MKLYFSRTSFILQLLYDYFLIYGLNTKNYKYQMANAKKIFWQENCQGVFRHSIFCLIKYLFGLPWYGLFI